jgi:hypothetical protein
VVPKLRTGAPDSAGGPRLGSLRKVFVASTLIIDLLSRATW